ncbi:hypothetical protein TI39_contig632g00003 [Zymoseptoria brevis]|uniref:DUF7730 domain-containing protein n=1 Tax=Zymoseptoria brevis TaxID=1047168 RepID=A0A0F4GHA4_9PEZI|nr:hypothetical protein TI39_contig632g00003 [Zymoseptoria brevis]
MADSIGGKNILDLPVEIRMVIYDYLLTEEKPVEIDVIHRRKKCDELIRHGRQNKRDWKHRFKKWSRAKIQFVTIPPINTAILFVNKQIHAEAVQSLYGNNCFSFLGTTGLKQAVELLGDHA